MSEARVLSDAPWLRSGPAARVLALLNGDGEEARVVGGAVRNALLKIPLGDIDIATTALPDEVARRAKAAGIKCVPTGIDGKPVDGEVAPFRIANPVAPERDPGLAAKGLGILAQGRDLEGVRVHHQRHRAMLDAGRHAFDAGRFGATDHFIGQCRGRNIDIAGRNLQ